MRHTQGNPVPTCQNNVSHIWGCWPRQPLGDPSPDPQPAACSCGHPPPEGNLRLGDKTVAVNGLPLIFDPLCKQGLRFGPLCPDRLPETVRICRAMETAEEAAYRDALTQAYQGYCRRRSKA